MLALSIGIGGLRGLAAEGDFEESIRPILEKRCAICHQGPNAQKGLRVATVDDLRRGGESGPAIVAGDPDASLILSMVSGEDRMMPPAGEPMSPAEVEALRNWIAAGAPYDESAEAAGNEEVWWSLRPLGEIPAPIPTSNWDRSPIDSFVVTGLTKKGLAPSAEADRRTQIRRLSFDLLGIPPTAEEVERFVRDSAPSAYERLVDRMLASPAYGERWGRHWLDVARFGESNGYEQNHLRSNAWPYRDWVIRAFNEDKPFDRMILEQLAGDQVAPDDPEVQAATGFLVAGPHDTVGIKNPEGEAQKRANHLDDMIMGTASAFLGLTVHCARCHDHKFDPIPTKDYYRMQAALAGVWHGERDWDRPETVAQYRAAERELSGTIRESEGALSKLKEDATERVAARRATILAQYRPAVDQAGTEERFQPVSARFIRIRITAMTSGRNQVDLDEFSVWSPGPEPRNVALAAVATASSTRVDSASPDTYSPSNLVDGKYDKRWITSGGLPAWVQVELPAPELVERVEWSSDRLGGFGGTFRRPQPESYEIQVSDDAEAWTTVASSDGRLPFSEEAQERLLLRAVFNEDELKSWDEHERRVSEAKRQLRQLGQPRKAFLGRFEEPAEPTFVMVRGNPMQKGEEVAPASLRVLGDLLDGYELAPDAAEPERRLALARWIASDRNALTARVIVNRVWMHHFGRPLVRNPSDFGINGGTPSHPDLLDRLAARLVGPYDWRLKPLHREIVLSGAYRQASSFRKDAAAVDSNNVLLWRFTPRRISAEELRDAILATTRHLDRRMGGPGFRLFRYTVDNVATYYPLQEVSPETYRRSVYHQHARSVKPDLLGEFDCPDSALPAPRRISTTSPLQALTLLNGRFALEQADAFATLIRKESGQDRLRYSSTAWRLAFGREPSDEESARARALVGEHGLGALARAILNASEFLYVF